MTLYPIFVDLRKRPCVVVGGGGVATRKVRDLLEAGARVRVIAPHLTPTLAALSAMGRFTHLPRRYVEGDLRRAFLALAATGRRGVNQAVWAEAERLGVPVNCVDDPQHCSFLVPATLRRGDLTVAISTAGRAPALAVRIRQQLEGRLGGHHARFLAYAAHLRRPLSESQPDFERRRALWYELVDSDVLELLERGEDERARDIIERIVGFAPKVPA